MQLFEYAILYTPIQTRDQLERGEQPKTELLLDVTRVVADGQEQAQMIAARAIPEAYIDKLSAITIALRPF